MNASLTLAWHVTKKDLRLLRGFIAMYVVLTLAQTLFRTVWPPLTVTLDPDLTQWLEPLATALPVIRMGTFALIVVMLVHADPLVGADAFWLTRPISRRVLFVSKLGTMLLGLALPATLAQVTPMIVYGVPPLDVIALLSENLLYLAAGLMAVFAAAALTPNQRSLVAWTFALFVLWAGASILMSGAPVTRESADGTTMTRDLRPTAPPSRGQLVTSLVLLATGCALAVWHQYRTRSRERSALIAAVTVGAVLAILNLFPRATLEPRWLSLTDRPAGALDAGIHFQEGASSVVMWPLGDRNGQCGVMVRVTQARNVPLAGAPPQHTYRFVHRPTRTPLAFTYFALPDRLSELAPMQGNVSIESFEIFQVLYRYTVVGPMFASRNPSDTTLKSVSCRDIDVVVRH